MEMEFQRLMMEADGLPRGTAKLALLEEAARAADLAGLTEQGYIAREKIVNTASFTGFPLKAIVAFSWQLAEFDKRPGHYNERTLLWSYKWILSMASSFPELSLQQIDGLLEDMRKRYKAYGCSDRTYYYYRFQIAMHLGDKPQAEKYCQLFLSLDRDMMSDCRACELDEVFRYFIFAGEDEKAIRTAEPILSGMVSCTEVPHCTYADVLMPLYRLGRRKKAEEYHQKGYRLIKGKREFLADIADHIGYLTMTNPAKGLELLELHFPLLASQESPRTKMMFHLNAASLLKRVSADGKQYRLRVPDYLSDGKEDGSLTYLADKLADLARSEAAEFDRRNGNDFYTSMVMSVLEGKDSF